MRTFSLLVVLLTASLASAAVLEDFEGGYAGPGTLMADPEDAGNMVLFLSAADGTDAAEVYQVVAPGTAGIVTMRIYDVGANTEKVDSRYGPRWGIAGDGATAVSCMNILYKSYISGYKGYTNNGTQGYPAAPTSTFSSPYWTMGTAGRYVKALDNIATTDVDEGQGAWATWTFVVQADGSASVKVTANDVVDASGVYHAGPVSASGDITSVGNLGAIFVSSGTDAAMPDGVLKFKGVMVDDVSFVVPEPATMGLLALGGLALLRRRR